MGKASGKVHGDAIAGLVDLLDLVSLNLASCRSDFAVKCAVDVC